MLHQFAGTAGHSVASQVVRAGADDPNHRRQRRGDQAGVGQWANAQHQVNFAQVRAMQVDEAVDQS